MDFDKIKQVWTKVNEDPNHPVYSIEDLKAFRKARSRDFSHMIKTLLITDIILKGMIATSFGILLVLFIGNLTEQMVCLGLLLVCLGMIMIQSPFLKKSRNIEREQGSVVELLQKQLSFLKSNYHKILITQGITNPLLVTSGAFFYYYFKYGTIQLKATDDILVFILMILISFVLTLPTTLSMYSFHKRTLESSLASLEDSPSWEDQIRKFKRSRKTIWIVFSVLAIAGLVIFIVLLIA